MIKFLSDPLNKILTIEFEAAVRVCNAKLDLLNNVMRPLAANNPAKLDNIALNLHAFEFFRALLNNQIQSIKNNARPQSVSEFLYSLPQIIFAENGISTQQGEEIIQFIQTRLQSELEQLELEYLGDVESTTFTLTGNNAE